jgi:serpin B
MAQTLELQKMSLQEVNQANADLRETLENREPNLHLSLANSLWVQEGVSCNPEFLRINEDFYQAHVRVLDFYAPNSLSIINDWVKQSTNGKIEKIIDWIRPDLVMILINAAYFKATWSQPFPKQATRNHPFTLLDGTQRQYQM